MARGTKVSVALEVDVTGTDDIDGMARSIDAAAKAAGKPIDVDAKVSGAKDVAGLSDDIAALPTSTTAAVDAEVAGASDITDLKTDLDALPASTATTIAADVSGQPALDAVAADIAALPASTATAIAADVSGQAALDAMAADIAALPATRSVSVSASVSGGKAVSDLNTDLANVDDNSGSAGAGLSGFASEAAGTLGGQFSDGVGMVADFGEQLGGLKEKFKEAGGGFQGFAQIAGGVGATFVAGFIVDTITSDLETAQRLMDESAGVVDDLTTSLIENGNQWDINAQKQLIANLQGTETFRTLQDAGASATDMLDAFYKGDPGAYARVFGAVAQGPKAFDATTIAALEAGKALIDSGGQAQAGAKLILDYQRANGLLDDTTQDTTASVKDTGDAMRDTGSDADYASQRVKAFEGTKVTDKESTLTADDKASPALDKYNQKKTGDKESTLKADDKASPALDKYNQKKTGDKASDIRANDYASERVDAFNRKTVDDKTAQIDADTTEAQRQIDALSAGKVVIDATLQFSPEALRASGWIPAPSMVAPEGASMLGAPGQATGVATAPRLRATLTVPVAGPTINISGALDPASTARQVKALLLRADRRVAPIRPGRGAGA